jgi:hypothetical protein
MPSKRHPAAALLFFRSSALSSLPVLCGKFDIGATYKTWGANSMAKRLPVPPELESLIEKREQETDRRRRQRRNAADAKGAGSSPTKASAGVERRQSTDRRQKKRRKRA